MTFKELNQMTPGDQKKWVEGHPQETEAMVYTECQDQYHRIGSVLPPQCCFRCQGCPIKTIVEGVITHG
jgi:hypothetical protein